MMFGTSEPTNATKIQNHNKSGAESPRKFRGPTACQEHTSHIMSTHPSSTTIQSQLSNMKRSLEFLPSESGRDKLQRRQDPVSCLFCRKKKLKCDRAAPCSNCKARRHPCSSASGGECICSLARIDTEKLQRQIRIQLFELLLPEARPSLLHPGRRTGYPKMSKY